MTQLNPNIKSILCGDCEGHGDVWDESAEIECDTCTGTGAIWADLTAARDYITTCHHCDGNGEAGDYGDCPTCAGSGELAVWCRDPWAEQPEDPYDALYDDDPRDYPDRDPEDGAW